jgi:hypothetical protein
MAASKALLLAAARVYEETGDMLAALDEAQLAVERAAAVWAG